MISLPIDLLWLALFNKKLKIGDLCFQTEHTHLIIPWKYRSGQLGSSKSENFHETNALTDGGAPLR